MKKTNFHKLATALLAAMCVCCMAFAMVACEKGCKHNYEYKFDAEAHWQVCSLCGDTTEKTAHTPDDRGKCVCGYQKIDFTVENPVTLNVDQTHKIAISGILGLTEADFTYSSYDPTVATVADDGTITGVAEGETTILVKAGNVRKTLTVTVIEKNKLNNVSYKNLKNTAALDWTDVGIGNGAIGALTNIAWDGATAAATAGKMDFENNKALTEKTLRGSVSGKNASIDNGDYVVVMSSANAAADDAFSATVYYKTTVSELANSFRLWGWASKSDLEISPASGKGMFRMAAYLFNADYTAYETFVMPGLDLGTLTQDENGWIRFEDVDDVLNGHIAGAPADNMFVFGVTDGTNDIRGKEVIISVEFKGTGATVPDRFGIKRLGFIYDDAPDFNLTSEPTVELFANGTSRITCGTAGAAASGEWTYVSDNEEVATVDATGLITAANVTEEGTCTVSITNSKVANKTLTVTVRVLPTPATSFTVPEAITVAGGEEFTIEITDQVACEDGFTFETLSDRIATVGTNGLVTGAVPGNTQIKVSCGELYKFVNVTVVAKTLYGLTMEQLATVGSMGNLGGFPAALDCTWSGKTNADNVSDDLTAAKMHLYKADDAALNDLVDPSLVYMINNIGGNSANGVTNALFFKYTTPAAANEFRVWIKPNDALDGIADTSYFRVVVYVLNEDGSAYVPHVMKLNASTSATATQDDKSGIITITGGAGDNFVNFIPTAEMLGKTDVIIAIEAFANVDSDLQSRLIVRRLGFDQ